MEQKNSKRSYYLPPKLIDAFAEWCSPGRDYSPKISAMILACLAIDDHDLVDQLAKLAHSSSIKSATTKARQLVINAMLDAEIQKHLDALGPAKEEFLRLLMQAKAKASEK